MAEMVVVAQGEISDLSDGEESLHGSSRRQEQGSGSGASDGVRRDIPDDLSPVPPGAAVVRVVEDSDSGSDDDEGEEDNDAQLFRDDNAPKFNKNNADSRRMEELAADLLKQFDPSRMQLTAEEHHWAIAIKKAVESLPDLDPLTDFMYAQLAIVSKHNIDDAVERAYRLQQHKRDNDIMDTLDDALRNLPTDKATLSHDFNLQTGGYVTAIDFTNRDVTVWKDPEGIRAHHRNVFYGSHMAYPDFEAIRVGGTLLFECEGYKLIKGKMVDLSIFKAIWGGVHAYPEVLGEIKFFHSPAIFNIMGKAAKLTLPKELGSKFVFGAKFPLGRLDKMFNLPTPEIARQRLQEKIKELIIRRYENEQQFRLRLEPESSLGRLES